KVDLNEDKQLSIEFPAEFKSRFNVFDTYGQKISDGKIKLVREGKSIQTEIEEGEAGISVPPGRYTLEVRSSGEIIAKQKIDIHSDKQVNVVSSQGSIFHLSLMVLGFIIVGLGGVVTFWKKKKPSYGLKLIAIGLLLAALFSSWWTVAGSTAEVSTSTKTLLKPSGIVTFTSADGVLGGDISMLPAEVSMVLNLVFLLLISSIIVVSLSMCLEHRYPRTSLVLSVLAMVLTVVSLSVFYYAFSEMAKISVGSFIGSGKLDVSIPGAGSVKVSSSWGPGLGFYTSLAGVVSLVLSLFSKKIIKKFRS
ncbi:MAG: hypothetical protein V5A64_04105, partial [Candidatus Thermoplasmatota archaeon]